MNGKTIRGAGVFWACAAFLGCHATHPKQDLGDPATNLPINAEVHLSELFDSPLDEEGITVETFHGPVRLIGLMDAEWERDAGFELPRDGDIVGHVHTDLIQIDGGCLHLSEPEQRRGL